MIAATSCVTRPSGKRSSAASGVVGARLALQRRVEVGDQHVVGLDRLKAAGLQAPLGGLEDERGRGVAHRPVGLAGLALEVCRTALGLAGLALVGLVGLADARIIEGGDDRLRIEAGNVLQRLCELGVLVEQQGGVEPREL